MTTHRTAPAALGALLLGAVVGCGSTPAAPASTAGVVPPPAVEQEFLTAVAPMFGTDAAATDSAIAVGEGACELLELGRTREEVQAAVRVLGRFTPADPAVGVNTVLAPFDTAQAQRVTDAAVTHLCPDEGPEVAAGRTSARSSARSTAAPRSTARSSTAPSSTAKPTTAPRTTKKSTTTRSPR